MDKYNDIEFYDVIDDILSNDEFLLLKGLEHHGITRYDHCLRVSYFTYKVTKFLHLNFIDATRAALLHDFFFDLDSNKLSKLRRHPQVACNNALKYFELNDMQEDIIKKHMFPITFTPPVYLESWIVDVIDDVSAIFERGYATKTVFYSLLKVIDIYQI